MNRLWAACVEQAVHDVWGERMTDLTAFTDQLLTVADAAMMLECPITQVRQLRSDGELAACYVGTQPMFRWGDVRSLQRKRASIGRSRSGPRNRVFGTGRREHRLVDTCASDTASLSDGCGEAL